MKVVIIGGDAAGMSAASKISRDDKNAKVIVLEKTNVVSYGACGLPYYIAGINQHESLLTIKEIDEFRKLGIDVRLGSNVIALSPEKKKVVYVHDNNMYEESFDKLVIATGGSPIRIPVKGSDLENVFTLKTIVEANDIIQASKDIKNIVIIGAGYIGMECAEAFAHLNKNVTVIERLPQILSTFDQDISEIVLKSINSHNICFMLDCNLEEILGDSVVTGVKTNKGNVEAELVLLSVGVKPNTSFAQEAGVETLSNGAIITNNRMETNIPDIYAAGDCATTINKQTKALQYIPLGTVANRQGKTLADVLLGKNKIYEHSLGNAALKLFEYEVARVGLNLTQAKKVYPFADEVIVMGMSHAPYYPNNSEIFLKLVFDKKSKIILGAQGFGKENVVWRINVLALGIDQETSLEDLSIIDLSYAPPFGMPWDVIHNAANAALKRCV